MFGKMRIYLGTGSLQIIFSKIFFSNFSHAYLKKHLIDIKVEAFELCQFNLCLFFFMLCFREFPCVAQYRTTSASINIYFYL